MNMLIAMGGLPKSGKTAIANKLADEFGATLFGTDHLLPENINELSEEEQKDIRLFAWQECHDEAVKFCSNKKNADKIAIYDTGGSSIRVLEEFERLCSIYDHEMLYVYVHDVKDRCARRGADRKLLDDYFEKFKTTLRRFKDRLMIIKNEGEISDLSIPRELCQKLSSKIRTISQ